MSLKSNPKNQYTRKTQLLLILCGCGAKGGPSQPVMDRSSGVPDAATTQEKYMKNNSYIYRLLLISLLCSPGVYAADSPGHSRTPTEQQQGGAINRVDKFMDDSTITAKVKTALVDDKQINSTNLSVSTNRGVVSIDGFVASHRQMARVKQLAESVKGVRKTELNLHLKPNQQTDLKSYASDTATTSEIVARLLADKRVSARHISVTTTHGAVLLTGNVSDRQQKMLAAEIARKVSGVSAVKNELSVSH